MLLPIVKSPFQVLKPILMIRFSEYDDNKKNEQDDNQGGGGIPHIESRDKILLDNEYYSKPEDEEESQEGQEGAETTGPLT
jgi:hypothetical protein